MMITRAFPLAHPDPLTISWMTGARFGVRWSAPACPTVAHATGAHATAFAVRLRDETSRLADVNVAALPVACPRMVSDVAVAPDRKSTRLNSSHQLISYA